MSGTLPISGADAGASPVRGWYALGSIAAGTFVMVTTEILPVGMLGGIAHGFRIAEGQAGLMVTIPGLAAAIAAPAAILLAGRVDRRKLLLVLSALIMASNLAVALAPSFGGVLAARVLLGLGVGGYWAFSAAVSRRLVPEKDGNRAVSVILAGISAGTVLGVPLGTALGAWVGWRAAFGAAAGVAALVVLLQAAMLPPLASRGAAPLSGLLSLLRVRMALVGLAASALIAGGHFAAYTYVEPLLSGRTGLPPGAISWALAGYGIAGLLGTVTGEKAGKRDLRLAFAGAAGAMAAAMVLTVMAGPHPGPACAGLLLWGIAFGAFPVCVQIWTYQAAPERFEAGSAVTVTVFQMALAIGAFGGGFVLDAMGSAATFLLGGVLAMLGGALILLAGRPIPPAKG